MDLRAARRQLVIDGLGIIVSAAGFGFVFGLAARTSGHYSAVGYLLPAVRQTVEFFAADLER